MPYHIDEENSELAFEVREGNKLVIKIKSNIFSDSLELYLIKVGDNTEPTDKNVFSSLRVLKEIENLHDTILKEINSVTSGFWELKQDSQGNEYIATKYNVLTEGGLTTYGLGEQKLGTIYDGLPIDNDTIYWEEVEGSRVLKAKGSGGGSTGLDETKLWNVLGTPGDQQIDYSHLRSAFSQFSNEFVTINTEQEITALKHFTAGLSVGESKKKIYEENGVVYIDADVAVTGAMTFYASAGRSVSTIMDGVTVDEETITKGSDNVLRIKNAGAGSSFDENAMWNALAGSTTEQINKSHLTTALDGYATQNWVIENYATKSELSAVSNKLNDFLEGSDTDNIINKWKELEAFLSGMAETDNLAEILETKADKKYVDSTFVTLGTKQTITGEKTFSSVLNTAAIKASGAITAPSLAVSDWVTIAGIKLRKLEDGALILEGNLALTGALTMYASNGQSFDTIYDGLPIDNDTIYWQEVDGSRVLKAREGSGSSFDKSAMWTALAGSTTEQINKSHLTTALTGYATESWVSGKNYAVKATTLAGYGITDAYTKTDADSRYVNVSGDTMTGKLRIQLSGRKDALQLFQSGTTDKAGLHLEGSDGISHSLYLTTSNLTWKGRTVWDSGNDGSGSGLDADLLDGTHKSGLLTALTSSSGTNISITVGGTTKSIADLYANSAAKLETARTIWGQPFDGTKPVTGALTSVTDITGTGTFTGANLKATDSVYVNGIRLHKTSDGVITLEGNLAVTGGVTTYAIDPVSVSTVMDGVVVDGTTIKKENGKLVAVGGGEAGSVAWGNISGKPSVFATNIANITDLHSSWDAVLKAQKPNWLTAVSIATISDLHANWDALLKAAPSAYVTRWPTISEVTNKQNLVIKLNGGTTEGTNQFTYNATAAKSLNITPAGIGAYTKSESDSKYPTKTGSGASGTWGINVTGNAGSAAKLQTARTLWGRSFDGTGNVSGNLDNVGNINTIGGTINAKVFAYNPSDNHDGLPWYGMAHYGNNVIAISGYGGIELFTSAGNALTIRTDNKVYANSYVASNSFRSTGDTGWYNEKWGGGWYMSDSNFLRSYSNKSIYIGSGSYVNAGGNAYYNNLENISEPNNCRYVSETAYNIPTGYIHPFCGWSDSAASGWTTSYVIGSIRNYANNWGEMYFGIYQYEGARREWRAYMALDGVNRHLYINGNLMVTGGGTFYGSDIRYKSIIQQIKLSLLDIAEAPSFVYRWNKKEMICDRFNIGGSAQYTKTILPWAVEEKNNLLTMDYATVAYTFAVHTARHLLTYETRTDKKIKKLEREIAILKKQLKKLGYEEVRTLDDSGI